VAFRKIRLEYRMKLIIPYIRFCADGHGKRDEVFRRNIWKIGQHAFEIAHWLKNSNVPAMHMNIQPQALLRSRRSSSSEPDVPTSLKFISSPSTASTDKSLREPNSGT